MPLSNLKFGLLILDSSIQEELQNPAAQHAVIGTVKAAILDGDPACPNLIDASVYEIKPAHYLSMVSELIERTEKEKEMYSAKTIIIIIKSNLISQNEIT